MKVRFNDEPKIIEYTPTAFERYQKAYALLLLTREQPGDINKFNRRLQSESYLFRAHTEHEITDSELETELKNMKKVHTQYSNWTLSGAILTQFANYYSLARQVVHQVDLEKLGEAYDEVYTLGPGSPQT